MKTKRIDLSVRIEVSDDPFEAAETIHKAGGPWTVMLENLKAAGVKYESRHATVVNRGGNGTPSSSAPRRPGRPRKSPASPQEQLPVAEDAPV